MSTPQEKPVLSAAVPYEVAELCFLLPRREMSALPSAAEAQGITAGALLRRMIVKSFLVGADRL
jgi:hypothetical protein